MSILELVKPTPEWEAMVMEFRREMLAEDNDWINGGGLLHQFRNYKEWLEHIGKENLVGNKGMVPATTFLVVHKENQTIVGIANVRHYLNENLRLSGGHVGYSVAPTERGKGYAGEMLGLATQFLREKQVDNVLVTCLQTNHASRRVIEKAGGILENEKIINGETTQRFWISIS